MKSKLLPTLLILLVLLNGFLIFMLIDKPHERKQEYPQRNFLSEQLNFSDAQKEKFKELDRTRRDFMMSVDKEVQLQKDLLFNSFSKTNFNTDSLTTKIGALEGKKEAEVFRFFSEVRKLCTPEQVEVFDKIIKKALRGGERKPPRRNGENRPPRGEEGRPPPR